MYIASLHPGDKARLVDFGLTPFTLRQRLLTLGITRGVEILLIRKAPLGCPIELQVRGTHLALRKEELRHIKWERL